MSYKDYLTENSGNLSAYFTNIDRDIAKDTETLWNIYKSYGYPWLIQLCAFEVISEYRLADNSRLVINATNKYIKNKLSEWGYAYKTVPHLLRRLYNKGFISYYRYDDNELTVKFTDENSRNMLTHTGIVPAMKIIKTMLDIRDSDGKYKIYDYAVFPHKYVISEYLSNPVRSDFPIADAMLVHNGTPLFIKCEHSVFPVERLTDFAKAIGEYGRENSEMLFTVSFLDENTEFAEKLSAIAKSLGVKLIINTAELDDRQLSEEIERVIK